MKRIISVLTIVCLVFSLVGCAKLVKTEYQEVEVKIVDEYHRGSYVTPIHAGKAVTMITHPAVYQIIVEYKGSKYTVKGSDTYNKYKNMVGHTTIAILKISTYDEGSVRYDITELQ